MWRPRCEVWLSVAQTLLRGLKTQCLQPIWVPSGPRGEVSEGVLATISCLNTRVCLHRLQLSVVVIT